MLNVHDGEQYTAEQRDLHDSDAVHGEHDDGNGNGDVEDVDTDSN